MEKDGKTLKQKAYSELKEFLAVSLYLAIFLGMFVQYKSVILAENQINFIGHGIALLNALALAKIMLIAKAFRPASSSEDAPLIYPTLFKSAIFAVILAVFKVLEDATIGYFHHESFTESIADLGGGGWKALFVLLVILFIILIPLTAFGELDRVVGEGKIRNLFLRPRDTSQPYNPRIVQNPTR
jgi:hypothetical protein